MAKAPDPPVRRAAVVIGVDVADGMTPLRAAGNGAEDMAEWLKADGYDVTLITDAVDPATKSRPPVTLKAVSAAVRRYLDLGSVEQLVIYFAGHGFLQGTAEIWLLSEAPGDPNEAIDQTESAEMGRSSGIGSIVFISDACRSVPQTGTAQRVRGGSIFPNRFDDQAGSAVETEVDRFFATRPGDPAIELPLDQAQSRYAGIFTEVLRQTVSDPPPATTRRVAVDGTDVEVVPNRTLKDILPSLVDRAARQRSITLSQKPQLRLECGPDRFVARIRRGKEPTFRGAAGPSAPPIQVPLLEAAVRAAIRGAPPSAFGLPQSDSVDSLKAAIRQRKHIDQTQGFETQAGFQVAGVVSQVTGIGVAAEILPDPKVEDGVLRHLVRAHHTDGPMRPPNQAGSVFIEFAEGTAALLPVLPGYVGSVTLHDGSVTNVSYVPSKNSPLWRDYYQYQKDEVEQLRALVAEAARQGVLAVDRDDAERFADKVRALKLLDPTLGIYSALAYAEAGLSKQAKSVFRYMRQQLPADLFDVWVLGKDAVETAPPGARRVVPPCPMLTQTWSYLRPRGVAVPGLLERAARRNALWTTFEADDVAEIRAAARAGALK